METAAVIAGFFSAGAENFSNCIPIHRQVQMYITNGCSNYTLGNPRWYLFSGSCASPFPPTIPIQESGSALFIKTPGSAGGSVGVITYDLLFNTTDRFTKKIAVMFSNPYDFNTFKNWFAVGVFDKTKECDEALYREMYYDPTNSFVRGKASDFSLKYKGNGVEIQAMMSDAYLPVIKVQVRETE